MTRPIYILTSLLLFSCGTKDESVVTISKPTDSSVTVEKVPETWEFESVQDRALHFKNRQSFETGLFELEYVGQVPNDKKAPYFIYSGRDCNECDANIAIYIHSPSDGKLNIDHGQNRYGYPGTLTYYLDNKPIQTSRAFYGQVLDNVKGVIWYTRNDSLPSNPFNSVYLVRIDNGIATDTAFNDDSKFNETLAMLSRGLCKEIPGQELTTEP